MKNLFKNSPSGGRGAAIKQHDITDCGAACLASVAAHYELRMPIARIRQLANTDQKGTNILGLLEAANRLGFQAKGVRGTFESLFKIPKPSIAHVIIPSPLTPDGGTKNTEIKERNITAPPLGVGGLHYVVIYEATLKYILVMDPANGKFHKKSHDDFKAVWTGALVLLLPDESFERGNQKVSVAARFWQLVRPHKTVMVEALFGAIIYTILGLATSIYVQKIIDNVLVEGNRNLLNLMSLGMIVIVVLQLPSFHFMHWHTLWPTESIAKTNAN